MNTSGPATPLGEMAYNYAIVGVQKGGTSTLAVTLNQHQLVCQAPDKERHYFDDETVDWSSPDYERDYTAPRRAAVHRLLGDASPTYLYWPHAMERMRAYKPDMPLVAVFRDPLERLFSHWVMLRSRNLAWPESSPTTPAGGGSTVGISCPTGGTCSAAWSAAGSVAMAHKLACG